MIPGGSNILQRVYVAKVTPRPYGYLVGAHSPSLRIHVSEKGLLGSLGVTDQ